MRLVADARQSSMGLYIGISHLDTDSVRWTGVRFVIYIIKALSEWVNFACMVPACLHGVITSKLNRHGVLETEMVQKTLHLLLDCCLYTSIFIVSVLIRSAWELCLQLVSTTTSFCGLYGIEKH